MNNNDITNTQNNQDSNHTTDHIAEDSVHTCPICESSFKSTEPPYPFCSSRCRMIDLGNWMDGVYKLSRPADENDYEQNDMY